MRAAARRDHESFGDIGRNFDLPTEVALTIADYDASKPAGDPTCSCGCGRPVYAGGLAKVCHDLEWVRSRRTPVGHSRSA